MMERIIYLNEVMTGEGTKEDFVSMYHNLSQTEGVVIKASNLFPKTSMGGNYDPGESNQGGIKYEWFIFYQRRRKIQES